MRVRRYEMTVVQFSPPRTVSLQDEQGNKEMSKWQDNAFGLSGSRAIDCDGTGKPMVLEPGQRIVVTVEAIEEPLPVREKVE